MKKSQTAFFSVSILALGLLGYSMAPAASGSNAPGTDGSGLQPAAGAAADCGDLAIEGIEDCARAAGAASVYGQLHNDDGSTTVWNLTFAQEGDTQVRRYRDLLLTSNRRLELETVITVEIGPDGRRELREVRNAEGQTVFHEIRRQEAGSSDVAIEQMPVSGEDPEDVIAVLERATRTLDQAIALSPSV